METITTPLTGTPYERLYTFARDILGYEDMAPQPHLAMCEFFEQTVKQLFIPNRPFMQVKRKYLVPRGCFKTTLGSVALPIWLHIQLPDLRILLDTHTQEYSKEILREIKDHYEFNEKLRDLAGNQVTDATRWAAESIVLASRRKAHKEPSIGTAAVDRAKTGGHYDFVINDDIVNEKNAFTPTGVKKVRRHVNVMRPILEGNGCQLMLGTRWAFNDVYGWLEENDEKRAEAGLGREWKSQIHGAWNLDGSLYFPTRLTEEFLRKAQLDMTDKMFSCWYLNEPIEESSKVFPRTMIKIFHPAGLDFYQHGKDPCIEIATS